MSTSPLAKSSSARKSAARKSAEGTPAIFSETQISLSAFLAGPLAGGFLFAWNALKLGRPGMAALAVAGAGSLTAGLVLASQVLPSHSGTLIALGVALALRKLTQQTFEEELESRRKSESGWQSNWTVAAVAIATLAALVATVLLTL